MASLRDVLNHVGKPVTLERAGAVVARGKATRRGDIALAEPKLEAAVGDVLSFEETGERFEVENVVSETLHDAVDHWRLRLRPL